MPFLRLLWNECNLQYKSYNIKYVWEECSGEIVYLVYGNNMATVGDLKG